MIIGIAAHGSSTRILGRRSGVPIHMPLYPGEYLNSLWLYVGGKEPEYWGNYSMVVRSYST